MRSLALLMGAAVIIVLAGCGTADERQWMKVSEKYTVEDFRRDYAACSKSAKLDEACMRSRGWVDMSPKPEKPPEPYEKPEYGSRRR